MKKEEKATEEKKHAGAKNSSLVGSKGERNNLKKGSENYDPKLQEFLQVMQPRMKSKLWANDTLITSTANQNVNLSKKQIQEKEEHKEKSFPVHVELDEPETEEHGLSDSHETKKSHNIAHDELLSDMDYFKSRVKQDWSDSESSDDDDDDDSDNDKNDDNVDKEDTSGSLKENLGSRGAHKGDSKGSNTTHKEVVPEEKVEEEEHSHDPDSEMHVASSLKDENEVLETSRLFVRNLPYAATYASLCFLSSIINIFFLYRMEKRKKKPCYVLYMKLICLCCQQLFLVFMFLLGLKSYRVCFFFFFFNIFFCNSEEELEEHFSKFGDVSQVHIVIDKDTKRSKGIAYIRYAVAESAVRLDSLPYITKSFLFFRLQATNDQFEA